VTDAQVVLGLLGDDLAGGEVVVHREAARAAVERVGVAVGVEPSVAADGILRVVRATMARAIRSVSVERGKDVRRYALAAFGGAGPLHAVALARDLGIGIVVVPPAPGALAALGLLVAARRCDASISRPMRADRSLDAELRTILAELTEQVLGELADEGVARAEASVALAVDCRYAGQSHELRIPVEGGPSFVLVAEAFHRSHAERYGFAREDVAVEAVTFRAAASGPPGEVSIRPRPAAGGAAPVSERLVGGVTVPVFDRSTLATDAVVDGPAIIAELDSTTWLPKGSRARAHAAGALVVEVAT
jgi:N-methylhydantoinase A